MLHPRLIRCKNILTVTWSLVVSEVSHLFALSSPLLTPWHCLFLSLSDVITLVLVERPAVEESALNNTLEVNNYWYMQFYQNISKCNKHILPRSTINRLLSSVKLDPFIATLFPKSSDSLSLSGLVSAQIVRLLKSGAFCITRFIALSPVGSPTSDTITMILLVFFSMYSSIKSWVTWLMRGSSFAKWAPGRSTKVRVVNSGPGERKEFENETIWTTKDVIHSSSYDELKLLIELYLKLILALLFKIIMALHLLT